MTFAERASRRAARGSNLARGFAGRGARKVSRLAPLVLLLLAGCRKDAPRSTSPDAAIDAGAALSSQANDRGGDNADAGTTLGSAAVLALVNPRGLPAYDGPTGSVEGTVFVTGAEPPAAPGTRNFSKCPAASATRARLFRTVPATADAASPRAVVGAVVAITGYADYFVPERAEARRVVVEHCDEAPPTITMTFGQRLEFQNKTKELFAPAIEQLRSPAVMLAPPGADAVKIYVERPGFFTLVDRMGGSFIDADVYVLLHPLHAATDAVGHYRIDGVPLGKLKVNARIGPARVETTADVEVRAGVVTRVDLTVPYVARATSTSSPSTDAGAQLPLR